MKKLVMFCSALAVTFLMSADLHSSSEGTLQSRETIEYCAQKPDYSSCEKKTSGVACYLVDANCDYIDDEYQPEP